MVSHTALPLSQHDLLDRKACATTEEKVIALKSHWQRRSQGGFFTLGAAAYIDASQHLAVYLDAAKERNPLLRETFASEYERIRLFFEELLGEPVIFDERLALPGFHIFVFGGVDQSRDNVAARAHFDLQWMSAIPEQVPRAVLSFTLLIKEPTGGAAMEVWPFRYGDARNTGVSAFDYASGHSSRTVGYTPGRIVVHDGLALHAIGRSATVAPIGFRITLQGHGVRLSEGWILYW